MKQFLTLTLVLALGLSLTAQEFDYTVTVNTPQLQIADASTFRNLENELTQFLNNQRWTNDRFEEHERIKCDLILNVRDELSVTQFSADLLIQSSRPVYGTNYESTILNHQDKQVTFTYEDSRPIIYSEDQFTDNLTSVLAFYAYYMLGMDYDSFSPYGGDPYFAQAQEIINQLPPALTNDGGWSVNANGRNRYFMIENILNPRSRPFRKASYNYHRLGMDTMAADSDQAKEVIITALKDIEGVNKDSPNSMIVQMFTNAKAQEVTDIFSIAIRNQKNEVYRLMTGLDPANRNKYIPIRR